MFVLASFRLAGPMKDVEPSQSRSPKQGQHASHLSPRRPPPPSPALLSTRDPPPWYLVTRISDQKDPGSSPTPRPWTFWSYAFLSRIISEAASPFKGSERLGYKMLRQKHLKDVYKVGETRAQSSGDDSGCLRGTVRRSGTGLGFRPCGTGADGRRGGRASCGTGRRLGHVGLGVELMEEPDGGGRLR